MNTDYGLGSLKFQLGAYDLNYGRQYGYEDNAYNQEFQAFLYKRKVTEEIACIDEDYYPYYTSGYIKDRKMPVVHMSHTCHKRSEGTYYWYKTG